MPTPTVPPAPVFTISAMPPYRAEAFARAIAARLSAMPGVDVTQALAGFITEQRALAAALRDPAFIASAATAYQQAMDTESNNPAYATPLASATRDIGGTLARRAADAESFATLLTQPDFIGTLRHLVSAPAPAPAPYQLPPEKQEETIRQLLQPLDPEGPEPSIHIAFTAQGQRLGHTALAHVWQPENGPLLAPLMQALIRQMPQMPGGQVEQLARDWLTARYNPAKAVAEGLAPNGAFTLEAIRRSEAMGTPAPAPSPQIITPPAAITRMAPTPNLMVDAL